MRKTFLSAISVAALITVAACAPVTQRYDDLTGTNIMQRCFARNAAVEQAKKQPEYQSDERVRRGVDAAFSAMQLVCPPPFGFAPAPVIPASNLPPKAPPA